MEVGAFGPGPERLAAQASGEARLLVGRFVLVNGAFGSGLVVLAGGRAVGLLGRVPVTGLGCLREALRQGPQARADALVTSPPALVLTVPLYLTLDVRQARLIRFDPGNDIGQDSRRCLVGGALPSG
jgi:hypothetical protein